MKETVSLETSFLNKLIEPHPTVIDARRRQAASVVVSLSLALLALNSLAGAIHSIVTRSISTQALAFEGLFLAVYLLGRGRRPIWGSGLLIVSTSAFVLFMLFRSDRPVEGIFWSLIPILLAVAVLSMWAAVAVVLLNLAAAVYAATAAAVPVDEAASPLLVIVFTSLITLAAKHLCERGVETLERQARELAESREHFHSLFEASPTSFWEEDFSGIKQYLDDLKASGISDLRTYFEEHPDKVTESIARVKIRDINQATLELFGATRKDQVYEALINSSTDQAIRVWQEELIALAEGRTDFEAETSLWTLGGEERNVLMKLSIAPGYEETWAKVFVSIADTSGRVQTETALQESEERFRKIAASAQDAIIMLDNEGNISLWNEAAERIFGYSRQEALGQNLHILLVPEQFYEAHRKAFRRFQASGQEDAVGKSLELVGLRRDGAEFPIEMSLSAVEMAGNRHSIGIVRDITERKQVERERLTLAALIEQAADTIVLTDLHGNITYANPSFERTSGYTVAEALGQNPRILKSDRQDKAFYRELWDTITSGKNWTGTFVNKRRDGSLYHEEATVFPVKDLSGQAINYAAVKRDVTERVQTQEDLQRRHLELATLNALTQALASSLELQGLLDEALSLTIHALGFDGGLISLADARSGELALSSYNHLPLSLVEKMGTHGFDGTPCGFVYREGKLLDLADLQAGAPVDVRGLLEIGYQSYVGAPIVHQQRTLGTLCLFGTTPRSISEAEQDLVIATGQQIGVAVENARLFEAVSRERGVARILLDTSEALSTTLRLDQLLERILDELRRVLLYDVASISLRYGERYQVAAYRGPEPFPLARQEHILIESPLLRRVVCERRPLVVPNVCDEADWTPVEGLEEMRAWLGVPLVARDEVIGVLMANSQQSNAYDEEAGRLTFAFARQAALAIENARLYEQTRAQLREVSLLHDISAALSATLDEARILSFVARSLCGILSASSVEICNLDEASDVATVVESYVTSGATEGERRSHPGRTYTLDDFPATAEALAQRCPLPLRLDAPETDPAERAALEARGARAALLLPLAVRDRLLGFVRVWDSQTARRFTPGEITLAQTLLHQATIALDNARLLEETQERVRQTELLLSASEAAASTLDGAEVLRRGARAVAKTLGADMAGAYLLDESKTTLQPTAGYRVPPDRLQTFLQFRIPLTGHPFVQEAWGSRQAVFSDDAAHDPRFDARTRELFPARSVLLIPMIVRDEIVGALWAVWWEKVRSFTEEELRLAEGIVRQAAIAIQNATLFEETQRRLRELQLLHDVGLAAASRVRLEGTLQSAAEALAAQLQEPRVALMLLDQESDTLQVKASVGYPPQEVNNVFVPLGKGITGWVAQHREPALVPDVRSDSRYLEVASDVRSELCVPLAVGEQVIGVLNVESPRHDAFKEDDQRLMSTLASNLAVFIERARLFEQVEAARAALQGQAEELEQANIRLQELAQVKSEFLANMSHELRTPLNAILGFAQLMERSSSLAKEHKENVRIINQSGEHLLDLINDVLDMSKIEAGRITLDPISFDIHRSLDSIHGMMAIHAEKKGLQLDFHRAPDVPRFVRTDERKLRQVLINLLGNGLKFTEEGGVVLRVGCRDADKAPPATPAPRLLFEVEDTGMGIAPEELDGLFEAFSQTASGKKVQQGTGLGLPISRKFVQMMGGDLTVSSQVGCGSTFKFEIQVGRVDAAGVESAQPIRRVVGLAAGQPDHRILVVDDRVENRVLLRQLLEPVGFFIQEAKDGLEAIELHARWQPHLILMDMRMPVLDGYQATQQIKATVQGQATVIIALTASALEEERSAILSTGCDDHVRKPFREADLFAKLSQHLNLRYVYAEPEPPEEKAEEGQASVDLASGVLDALPPDWVTELHDAASRARGDLVLGLLARIEAEHAPLARALAQLVDEFQFDRIMSLAKQ